MSDTPVQKLFRIRISGFGHGGCAYEGSYSGADAEEAMRKGLECWADTARVTVSNIKPEHQGHGLSAYIKPTTDYALADGRSNATISIALA